MPKHIHVHLHDAASVIPPTPGAPTKTPKKVPAVKPIKATTSVIKAAPHTAIKGVHLVTKGVVGLNKGIRKIGELAEAKDNAGGSNTSETKTKNGVTTWGASTPKKALDAGTSEGAKKAWQTRQHGGSSFEANEYMQHQRGYSSRGTGHYDVHHNNQKVGTITPTETKVSGGGITSGSKSISGKRGITLGKAKTKTTYLGHHEPTGKRFSGTTANQVFNQIVEHHSGSAK